MFQNPFKKNSNPIVKPVSSLIDTKSHRQKKYISLMFVPSYSTGKTRSLRIPRIMFHCVLAGIIMVSAVIVGLNIRSNNLYAIASNLSESLEETQVAFKTFQEESEQIQNTLIDTAAELEEQLSLEERRARRDLESQAREHQGNLSEIWDLIDQLEDMIIEFEARRQEAIVGLSARSIIPPVARILDELNTSQAEIRSGSEFQLLRFAPTAAPDNNNVAAAGFLSTAVMDSLHDTVITEDELVARMLALKAEIEVQEALLDDVEEKRAQMEIHLNNHPTIWPVNGRISSAFGWRRNPLTGRGSEFHGGIDIPAPTGTPIRAAGGGTVTFQGWRSGYGNTVMIDHGNGIVTLYAHNTRNNVVVGQRVSRGDIIAFVGSTGRSTGPHVHYEVIIHGQVVDPVTFLLERFS